MEGKRRKDLGVPDLYLSGRFFKSHLPRWGCRVLGVHRRGGGVVVFTAAAAVLIQHPLAVIVHLPPLVVSQPERHLLGEVAQVTAATSRPPLLFRPILYPDLHA